MRDVLRKVLIFVGLMILLAGLVFLAFGSVRSTVLEQVTTLPPSYKSWEVSGNLTGGNTYVLNIYASTEWETDWTEGGYSNSNKSQPVGVVITSPDGGETNLEACFYGSVGIKGPGYSEPGTVTYVETIYESNNSTCLSVDTPYVGALARFTVLEGGNYTARVSEAINWTSGPPGEMLFEEEVTVNPSSFTNLLEGSGLAFLFTGAIVLVCAFRASKEKRIKRKSARAKS